MLADLDLKRMDEALASYESAKIALLLRAPDLNRLTDAYNVLKR